MRNLDERSGMSAERGTLTICSTNPENAFGTLEKKLDGLETTMGADLGPDLANGFIDIGNSTLRKGVCPSWQ